MRKSKRQGAGVLDRCLSVGGQLQRVNLLVVAAALFARAVLVSFAA